MNTALTEAFFRCNKKAALLTFITAGYPRAESTLAMLCAMAEAGADIIEVGVPFSDPMADGGAIQRSSQKALENGMTLIKTLAVVKEFKTINTQTPVVLMGYTNSFISYDGGIAGFSAAAQDSGVSGIIVVDLSDENREQWRQTLNLCGIDMICLIAPTTSDCRRQQIAKQAQGFVYAISLVGITGATHIDVGSLDSYLNAIKKDAAAPVVSGFGVREPQHARQLAALADGVVVGSRLVEAIEQAQDNNETESVAVVVRAMAQALKSS